ncbi:MAG: hypothetical protein ABSG94_02810 [Brevinematales bacterium]
MHFPSYWTTNLTGGPLTETDFPYGPSGPEINTIFVTGNNVYAAGVDGYDPAFVCYWINGIETQLADATTGFASSIFVFGESAYVAGNDKTPAACYWINGVKQLLANGGNGRANSIFVISTNSPPAKL